MSYTEWQYAPGNLFVGKYQIPEDGHIRLGPNTSVQVKMGIITRDGWVSDEEGEPWLIVDDGEGFWPVMIQIPRGYGLNYGPTDA